MKKITRRILLSTSPPAALIIVTLGWAWRVDVSGARAGMGPGSTDQESSRRAEQIAARKQRMSALVARQNMGSLDALEAAELRLLREQDKADLVSPDGQ